MTQITKQSIKIELENEGNESQRDLLEDTLFNAVSMLAENDEEEDLILTTRFFTLRFDETDSGTVAATITASEKRGA
jgi:hypothetical protein